MARVSTTKHQHKPNQQKLTTQIKQPKIKLSGTNRTIERNARKEQQKIKLNGTNRTKFNKQQQKETTNQTKLNEQNEFQKLKRSVD